MVVCPNNSTKLYEIIKKEFELSKKRINLSILGSFCKLSNVCAA